jgi:hypothetical protein
MVGEAVTSVDGEYKRIVDVTDTVTVDEDITELEFVSDFEALTVTSATVFDRTGEPVGEVDTLRLLVDEDVRTVDEVDETEGTREPLVEPEYEFVAVDVIVTDTERSGDREAEGDGVGEFERVPPKAVVELGSSDDEDDTLADDVDDFCNGDNV